MKQMSPLQYFSIISISNFRYECVCYFFIINSARIYIKVLQTTSFTNISVNILHPYFITNLISVIFAKINANFYPFSQEIKIVLLLLSCVRHFRIVKPRLHTPSDRGFYAVQFEVDFLDQYEKWQYPSSAISSSILWGI